MLCNHWYTCALVITTISPALPYQLCESRGNNIESVKRWARGVDLFAKDFVLVPINIAMHWSLVVIVRPGLVVVCILCYYKWRILFFFSFDSWLFLVNDETTIYMGLTSHMLNYVSERVRRTKYLLRGNEHISRPQKQNGSWGTAKKIRVHREGVMVTALLLPMTARMT